MRAAGALRFEDITRRYLDEGFFPGAVLRVERAGKLVCEEAWGHALFTGTERVPMENSTLFDLASVSKLFTMTALLRLVTLGTFGLRDPVAALLGRFATELGIEKNLLTRLASAVGTVDVAALLTHSSGMLSWYPFYTRRSEPFETILADVLEAHPRRPEVIYSDLNFMLLGRIIEGATHLPLPAALEALVMRPLGLARTSYKKPLGSAAATELGNRIERVMVAERGLDFSGWRDETRPIRGEPDDGNCYYYFDGAAGHAGAFSDARDLCRLGRLYIEDGRVEGAAWLADGLTREAMRDHGGMRGLGFQLGENYPGGGCGHTGFTGTYLHVNSSAGLVIAILTNRLHVPEPRDINPYRRELSEAVLSAFAG